MSRQPNKDAPLISFLRYLADSIEYDTLPPSRKKVAAEFYLAWQFQEEVPYEGGGERPEDFIKYLVMGWWVYSQLTPSQPESPAVD